MRTVRDEDDRLYVLLSESSDASRVRDVETGEESYVENDRLDPADGESRLEAAARAVPGPTRRAIKAVRDDAALGILVVLQRDGPLPAEALLDATTDCESDHVGRLTELRAAGLLDETTVAGVPGYELTEDGRGVLEHLLR